MGWRPPLFCWRVSVTINSIGEASISLIEADPRYSNEVVRNPEFAAGRSGLRSGRFRASPVARELLTPPPELERRIRPAPRGRVTTEEFMRKVIASSFFAAFGLSAAAQAAPLNLQGSDTLEDV